MTKLCYCGSSTDFIECCQPIIQGTKKAETALSLMKSRYVAYCVNASDYLIASTHRSQRHLYPKADLEAWATESTWQKLEIIRTKQGQAEDSTGEVEFKAFYIDSNQEAHIHHEQSHFVKEDNSWFFHSGQIVKPSIPNRNDACTCGSGKKYKKCCGR